MEQSDALAVSVLQEQEQAAGQRGHWEKVWEDIARRILPNYASHFTGQNRSPLTDGAQLMTEMVDSTGALALGRFAAAMESMLTPRNSPWHSLVPSDRSLMRDHTVRRWFEDATRLLFQFRYAASANFQAQKHEDYLMLGAFGTGCLFVDALASPRERGIRYRAVHLGQCYFQENHQGIIDTNYRKFSLTARQAAEQFGPQTPEVIMQQAADAKRAQTIHWFIHKVAPRQDYDEGRADLKGMAFESVYVSLTGRKTVRHGGYHTFPYAISRYVTTPGELYGRSPAMMALPTIRSLNEMKKTILKQGHRAVDPVLLAHDDGIVDNFSMRPGAINAGGISAEGRPLIQPLPVGNLAVGDHMMDAEKLVINDFFLVTLFQILVDTPQMTATEVVERAREKGALLSPTMGRQQSESLGPMIERELDVLRELRVLPPMPQRLLDARGEYTVQYDSPLSRMARAEEAAGFMRSLETALRYMEVSQDPAPLDHFNMDEIMPETMDIHAMPVRWRRSLEEIQQIRAQRAQAAQQKQLLDAAPAGAAMLKTAMGATS